MRGRPLINYEVVELIAATTTSKASEFAFSATSQAPRGLTWRCKGHCFRRRDARHRPAPPHPSTASGITPLDRHAGSPRPRPLASAPTQMHRCGLIEMRCADCVSATHASNCIIDALAQFRAIVKTVLVWTLWVASTTRRLQWYCDMRSARGALLSPWRKVTLHHPGSNEWNS